MNVEIVGWCEIGDDGVSYLSKVMSKQTEMLNLCACYER